MHVSRWSAIAQGTVLVALAGPVACAPAKREESASNAGGSPGTGGAIGLAGASQGGAGGGATGGGGSPSGGTVGAAGKSGAAGGSAGGKAGSTGADPCSGIPPGGKCLSSTQAAYCSAPTGQGNPTLAYDNCAAYETCTTSAAGTGCTLKPGACVPGSSSCQDASTQRICSAAGAWATSACLGCKDSVGGPICQTGKPPKIVQRHVAYEVRGPNGDLSDWGLAVTKANVVGAAVLGFESINGTDVLVDATETDANGNFTLSAGTKVVVYAMRVAEGGIQNGLKFGLFEPGIPDGEWKVADPIPSTGAHVWGWQLNVASGGTDFTIPDSSFSGAMRVFDYMRYVYDATKALTGAAGKPFVVWIRRDTSFSCGACMWDQPTTVSSLKFQVQGFIPATAADESYWSDPVTAHELGHWVMASFGVSPGEGGPHTLGCATYPGQAWSEGWATFFSSLARQDAVYYDKQNGSFFWVDVGSKFNPASAWVVPTAAAGLLQQMEENEVASELWSLRNLPTGGGSVLGANGLFLTALQSPRMTKAPFARGYTRHTWEGKCMKTDVKDAGTSSPMYADFLDALRCGGMSAAKIDAVTKPTTNYPYPSQKQICQ